MEYTIGEVAKMMGLTAHTLRYYDKEGLLPYVRRTQSGIRYFSEKDIDWLVIVECLKSTGLQIKEIKDYLDLCQQGVSTLNQRLAIFEKQKKHVEQQIAALQQNMEKLNFKIQYYEEAIKCGNEDVFAKNDCLLKEKQRIFKR